MTSGASKISFSSILYGRFSVKTVDTLRPVVLFSKRQWIQIFRNLQVVDIPWVAEMGCGEEYLHFSNWQILQIQDFLFLESWWLNIYQGTIE